VRWRPCAALASACADWTRTRSRAVATNTLRVAKNAGEFLPLAEEALGFPIEIIAGREEARLIYLGVSHSLPAAAHPRLVVDIGGGSTEFIIGRRHRPHRMESLYMGCVSYTLRFFPDGRVDRRRLREAQVAAAKEIELIAHDYKGLGWKEAFGSSGSARGDRRCAGVEPVESRRRFRHYPGGARRVV
jgi:exopolyphosphatase/guanosine-5'-triphosphate,3'-diphosphate pyrophosphatase